MDVGQLFFFPINSNFMTLAFQLTTYNPCVMKHRTLSVLYAILTLLYPNNTNALFTKPNDVCSLVLKYLNLRIILCHKELPFQKKLPKTMPVILTYINTHIYI